MGTNGQAVAAFEREFAAYVGAKFAIALCNGTATLHTALLALGVKPGDRVAVPPLTMSATTIAVLQAGAVPVFVDVDPLHWLMTPPDHSIPWIGVDLYGLTRPSWGTLGIADAAQTLRRHDTLHPFTSYSFQASKILALGEGGMLVTDDGDLATRARSISSLGYEMRADQPRIDPKVLKSPTFARHHRYPCWNYRMNDETARHALYGDYPYYYDEQGDTFEGHCDWLKARRREAASFYRNAIQGCEWLRPQAVPEGWTFDAWTYAFAVESVDLWHPLTTAMVKHGAEMPYACWRITYQEPAFRHLAPDGTCPIAEDLQPRIVQCQTNNLKSAEKNASALQKAIREVGGSR